MHILNVGLNYKTASIEVREKLNFSNTTLKEAIDTLQQQEHIMENVIISTCNRTEIYAMVDQIQKGKHTIIQFLANWFQLPIEDVSMVLQFRESEAAVEHLFRVTTGLDSMIVGETEILGQVKTAFLTSQQLKGTGKVFNELFKRAITFAKKSHKVTAIGEQTVSVSYAAVQLVKNTIGSLTDKHIIIVGAGNIGELTVKNVQALGTKQLTIINRTYEKAVQLSKVSNATPMGWNQLEEALASADILISTTSAKEAILNKDTIEALQNQRNYRPLVLVDLGVPRNIDPMIRTLDGIILYDIDDLQRIVDDNVEVRKKAASVIEQGIESEIMTFDQWMKTLRVVPIISTIRQKGLEIQAETMKSMERKMPDLTEREKKILHNHTKSIVNQLIKDPIMQLKELAKQNPSEDVLDLVTELYGIGEGTKEQK